MSKKAFKIAPQVSTGFADTIKIAEGNESLYRNTVIPLTRLEPDPDNPRKLFITDIDVRNGIANDDVLAQEKNNELLSLKELAESIKLSGLINPIIVVKHLEKYRIVAGERRYLASLLAEKETIEARVFHTKPKDIDLKLIQWFENTAREDLPLIDRIDNIKEIVNLYIQNEGVKKVTAEVLSKITGLSISQTASYLSLLNADESVIDAVRTGALNNLDKAALIANCGNMSLRQQALDACSKGVTIKELRVLIADSKKNAKVSAISKKDIKEVKKISLGQTSNIRVIHKIADAILNMPEFRAHRISFQAVNWKKSNEAINALKNLITLLEQQESEVYEA